MVTVQTEVSSWLPGDMCETQQAGNHEVSGLSKSDWQRGLQQARASSGFFSSVSWSDFPSEIPMREDGAGSVASSAEVNIGDSASNSSNEAFSSDSAVAL